MGAGRAPLKLGPMARFGLGLAVVALVVIRLAFVELVSVSGNTMAPNILDGDVLVVLSQAEVRRGDVVLVEVGEQAVLRRVIGVPGDVLGSAAGVLTRDELPVPTQVADTFAWRGPAGDDGVPGAQHRQYQFVEALGDGRVHHVLGDHVGAARPWTLELPQVEVPPGNVFVLCDNRRLCPLDERAGIIPLSAIQGVARSMFYGDPHTADPEHRPFYGAFSPLASAAPPTEGAGRK